MNRTYECMVLLDNREVRQGWDALKDNVTGLMKKHGAEIVSAKLWEERKLAYPIRQQQRGTYLLVYFNSPTEGITPMNRELNMAEPVMRHMVTVCEEIPESAHEPEADFDVSAIGTDPAPAPEPEAAPARGARGRGDARGERPKREPEATAEPATEPATEPAAEASSSEETATATTENEQPEAAPSKEAE